MPRAGFFSLDIWQPTEATQSRVPKCGACKLHLGCNSPKMAVAGKGRKGFMVIGEAPGETEDKEGKPFVGKTGQRLQKELTRLGIDLFKDCYVTNTLICRPPDNAKPTDKQIEFCRPNLVNAIDVYKPHTIVLVGGPAIQSIISWLWKPISLKKDGVGRWVGWNIPSQEVNAWICPTYHPSYVEREDKQALDTVWRQHLEKAFSHKSKPWRKVPHYKDRVTVCTESPQAVKLLRKMIATGAPLAFDYETNMLKPDSAASQILCCGVSDGKTAVAFWWDDIVEEVMAEWLASDSPKTGANIKFEERWTQARLGLYVNNWQFDVGLGAHVLDNRKMVSGVKFQSFVRLGQKDYAKEMKGFMSSRAGKGGYSVNRLKQANRQKLMLYCGLDALLEALLAKIQKRELFDG